MARTRLQEALIHVPALVVAAGLAACSDSALHAPEPPGDAARGRLLLHQYHCDACHRISGVAGLDGVIGPPLDRVGSRVYLAGMLPNTPEHQERWIRNPEAVKPGTAMPNAQVTEADARDMVAYLYRLR
jgi:cytochrome c1